MINKRDGSQVHSQWPIRILYAGSLPTSFSFDNCRPGQPTFQLQGDHRVIYVRGDSEHDLIPHQNS
jgi:hypothetical protein